MKQILLIISIALLPYLSQAQKSTKSEITWNGSVSSDWQTSANWTPSSIPLSTDNVIIANAGTLPIIDDGSTTAVCNSLTINSGAILTIASNGRMTVSGTLTNNAGTTGIVLKSDAVGHGSLIFSSAGISGTSEMYLAGDQWHYVSSLVSNVNSSDFSVTDFKYWDAAMEWDGANYDPWKSFSGTLANGGGYANNETSTTKSFEGTLNQGNINIPISMSATGTPADQGWNLIGNPYTSAIDWTSTSYSSANLDNAVYYYNGTTYATYVSGSGTNGGTKYIASGQAFFVKCNNSAGGTLSLTNANRVHNFQAFWKKPQTSNSVRLLAQGNGYYDEAVIRFITGASYTFDSEFDAYKLVSSNPDVPQVYSLDSAKATKYSINSMPVFVQEIVIPVGFQVTTPGSYTISASETDIDARFLFLEDLALDSVIDLRKLPVYRFTFAGGISEDRFILRIKPNTTPVCDNPVADMQTNEDEEFNFSFPANVFSDADGDLLNYYSNQSDGSNLPAWLNFSNSTRTFSGMPLNENVEVLHLTLFSFDTYGDTAFSNFDLEIINTNDAPFVDNSISDQVSYVGNSWDFTFADNTFADSDAGDVLSYSANLSGGGILPDWLDFNPGTRTFSGFPPQALSIEIEVTATDLLFSESSDIFKYYAITNVGVNDIKDESNIFPNPSNGIFNIKGENINEIQVINLSGIVIFDKFLTGKGTISERIDISNMAKGIYFIKISKNTKLETRRIIIK